MNKKFAYAAVVVAIGIIAVLIPVSNDAGLTAAGTHLQHSAGGKVFPMIREQLFQLCALLGSG